MGTKLNKNGYSKLIAEDIEWLLDQPRSLERDHIHDVLKESINLIYDNAKEPTNQ